MEKVDRVIGRKLMLPDDPNLSFCLNSCLEKDLPKSFSSMKWEQEQVINVEPGGIF